MVEIPLGGIALARIVPIPSNKEFVACHERNANLLFVRFEQFVVQPSLDGSQDQWFSERAVTQALVHDLAAVDIHRLARDVASLW